MSETCPRQDEMHEAIALTEHDRPTRVAVLNPDRMTAAPTGPDPRTDAAVGR